MINSISCIVTYDGQFWVGIFEKLENGVYSVARCVFGAEPTDPEVFYFILKNYDGLKFTTPFSDAPPVIKKVNPKRKIREVRKIGSQGQNISKAQDALRIELEKNKKERKTMSREKRNEEADKKFQLKQQKRKEKKRGH